MREKREWVFSMGFSLAGPSPRVITGEKHAGNLGVGESIAQKKLRLGALCLTPPCALNVSLGA